MLHSNIHSHPRSHAVSSDVDISETARAAEFFCSDGIIVTGRETGLEPCHLDIYRVCDTVSLPVLVGSGITDRNVNCYKRCGVDAMIVGSYFKEDGWWYNDVHRETVENFMHTWASKW